MLEQLKQEVLEANLELVTDRLVLFTWGNVSGFDPESGLIVIKPSGVPYSELKRDDLVVVDLDGKVVEGKLRPSSDTPTHLEIYRRHKEVHGVVHTHSTFATAFAQAGRGIPPYGTTHADYFYGEVPCTRALRKEEIEGEYEKNTGKVINELYEGKNILAVPACLVRNHGVFAFGKGPKEAVFHAAVLEETAKMAYLSEGLDPDIKRIGGTLLDKHYLRKHGKNAYYGQKK